jgi:hypothetical protein
MGFRLSLVYSFKLLSRISVTFLIVRICYLICAAPQGICSARSEQISLFVWSKRSITGPSKLLVIRFHFHAFDGYVFFAA